MAEATRAREDLKDCLQYVVKLKAREGEEESRRIATVTEPTTNVHQTTKEASAFVTPEKTNATAITIRQAQFDAGSDEKQYQETPLTHVTEATSQSTRFLDDQSICTSFSSDGYPRRNLALCFWTQRGKETVGKGPAFERMEDDVEPKRTSLFRKRQKNQKKKTRDKPSSKPSHTHTRMSSSQRAKAVKLNQSLAEASREAGELRSRLHSITKYYDNIVISLQQNAGSNNTEYEADMINQLSFLDREKRAVSTELRQKDNLMALYQRKLALLEEDSENVRNGDVLQAALV